MIEKYKFVQLGSILCVGYYGVLLFSHTLQTHGLFIVYSHSFFSRVQHDEKSHQKGSPSRLTWDDGGEDEINKTQIVDLWEYDQRISSNKAWICAQISRVP